MMLKTFGAGFTAVIVILTIIIATNPPEKRIVGALLWVMVFLSAAIIPMALIDIFWH